MVRVLFSGENIEAQLIVSDQTRVENEFRRGRVQRGQVSSFQSGRFCWPTNSEATSPDVGLWVSKYVPQRLKPSSARLFTARLNPCPSLGRFFLRLLGHRKMDVLSDVDIKKSNIRIDGFLRSR